MKIDAVWHVKYVTIHLYLVKISLNLLEWLQRNEAFCIGCHNSVLHKFVRIETCDAQWLFKLPTTHCSKRMLLLWGLKDK